MTPTNWPRRWLCTAHRSNRCGSFLLRLTVAATFAECLQRLGRGWETSLRSTTTSTGSVAPIVAARVEAARAEAVAAVLAMADESERRTDADPGMRGAIAPISDEEARAQWPATVTTAALRAALTPEAAAAHNRAERAADSGKRRIAEGLMRRPWPHGQATPTAPTLSTAVTSDERTVCGVAAPIALINVDKARPDRHVYGWVSPVAVGP